VPLVRLDNRGGARQATAHLLELGHRAIAHVTGPQRLELSRERLAGYTGALKSAGVAYDRLVIESDFTELGGYDSVRALLASGVEFSALFCGNDLMAVGAMNALLEERTCGARRCLRHRIRRSATRVVHDPSADDAAPAGGRAG
jgi:DNA-binding LacI/PurR family transcriptional regulator